MGVIAHKSLIVTGQGMHFTNAYDRAKELFEVDDYGKKTNMVSNILGQGLNEYYTFCVAPDGSKEGWSTSDFFDARIEEMIEYLKSNNCTFSDNSSFNQWVLVQFGETGRRVLKSNCKNMY